MPQSLIFPNRKIDKIPFQEFAIEHFKTIQSWDPSSPIRFETDAEDASKEIIDALKKHRFQEVPSRVAVMTDLTPYSSPEEFYKNLPNMTQRNIKRCNTETDGSLEFFAVPCQEMTASLIAEFYSDVLLPFCSFRGVSPYQVSTLDQYIEILRLCSNTGLTSNAEHVFLGQRLNGKLVSGIIMMVQPLSEFVQPSILRKGEIRHTHKIVWSRTTDSNEKVASVLVAFFKPFLQNVAVTARISDVAYWNAFQWACAERVSIFAMGSDEIVFQAQYMGVYQYKVKWLGTPAFLSPVLNTHYIRLPSEWVFREGSNCMYFYNEEDAPGLNIYLPNFSSSIELIRILNSNPYYSKKIVVKTDAEREQIIRAAANNCRVEALLFSEVGKNQCLA
jgi:hypothetical protein